METGSELGTRANEASKRLPPPEIIEAFARHVPGAIYIYRRFPSGNACVDYISDGIEDIYGYTPDELYADVELGHRRIHPEDRPGFDASVASCFESAQPWKCEYRVILPDRGIRYVSAAATLERQQDGSVIWIGHLIDVTEFAIARHHLQEEILRAHQEAVTANKAKSTFIAHVSHDLRTPLHGIMGLSELIAGDVETPTHVRRQATEINKAGAYLLKLIADVIDLSAIEAGRLALSLEPVSVAAVVDVVTTMAQPISREHGITLTIDEQLRGNVCVLADGTRLAQVLLNLVGNGIKYNRPNGHVTIQLLAASDKTVRIGVQDTGSGLSPDAVEHLFDPFNRLGREMSEIEGSGIGLVITKNLVESMNGSIGVDSEPGMGSTFWMELPRTLELAQPSTVSKRENEAHADVFAPVRLRVLVAEDNPLSREVFSSQLRKLGCAADVVDNGIAAWEAWRSGGHDVVITDVHMPGVSGFELTQRIRANEIGQDGPRTYIIGASANAMKEAFRDALARGMDDYVTKPLSLAALRTALHGAQRKGAGARLRPSGFRDDEASCLPDRTALPGPAISRISVPLAAATQSAIDAPPVAAAGLDFEFLEELTDGDGAQLGELVRLLLDSADMCMAELTVSEVPRDGQAIEHAAHKLKSSARTVGASHLGTLCDRVEAAVASADWGAVETIRADILAEYRLIRASIEKQIAC